MLGLMVESLMFVGRAERLDYWLMTLGVPFVLGILSFILIMLGRLGIAVMAVMWVVYVARCVGVPVRRLHDVNKSAHCPNAYGDEP